MSLQHVLVSNEIPENRSLAAAIAPTYANLGDTFRQTLRALALALTRAHARARAF
jgi:hypothetical protein